ncbi:A disintegrin and metallopeptidase domain 3 [Marmota monax]|nr:A disintegrin and metallopeptidase domain 3 [Marmota monax]
MPSGPATSLKGAMVCGTRERDLVWGGLKVSASQGEHLRGWTEPMGENGRQRFAGRSWSKPLRSHLNSLESKSAAVLPVETHKQTPDSRQSLGRDDQKDNKGLDGSKSSLLQITVPEKFDKNTNRKDVTETHVTYSITIEEKTYILSLKKQSYLAPNFPVFSYSKWGSLQEDSLFVKGDCFYQGNIEDIPQSAVTLDICSGLRGFLLLENVSYGIEPLESSAVFEHMIYQINNDQVEYPPLTEGYSRPHYIGQPYRILVKTDKTSEITLKTTLKIQIIIDKAMFEYMDSDIDVAAEKVIHIIGLINTMFSRLKMTVMLSSLEIWSDQNKISTNGSADEVLQRFLSWKQTYLSSRSNNMAYLLIYKDHPNFVGATYHGMACDPKFSAGILLVCILFSSFQ